MKLKSIYHFENDGIHFERYCFYFSSINKNKKLPVHRINAVNFQTIPYSLIIDFREVIFLNHGDVSIRNYALKNNIPASNHPDLWAILNEEFLDTEQSADAVNERIKFLSKFGIDKNKIDKIRRKNKWLFSGTYEWQYLGHWDLLAYQQNRNPFYRLFGKKFYWESMKIALSGYKFDKN
ncbi:MAG: hypothetical protein N3F09_02880 [Bacteroidia bacterium]|nr:hypothetical protein [Bacteroidia bacterium]